MNRLQCVFDVKTKETIPVDLDEIIKSRALFQANSGGGKSYLLRKFLEESHGKVQQLIVDPEGEFKTLKEKYDYLLVSKEESADIKLETRHAGLLAKKLMETGASAILDLYELNPFDRIRFVKAFVEALVNLPKYLWHPCIIVIDEIHTFAPENAKGSSESLQAVADLASRGRKRGYALVGATQKLSKFHKDVAAELNTKFTGRCVLDIDQKRAAAELGMKDYTELRNLKNEFYAFGPAVSGTPVLVKAYPVKTEHEDIGSSRQIKSASQDKINKLKESFKDLPVEAEQELKTIQDFQKKIQEQSIEIRNLKNSTNSTITKLDPQAFQKSEQLGYSRACKEFEYYKTGMEKKVKDLEQRWNKAASLVENANNFLKTLSGTSIPIAPLPRLSQETKLPFSSKVIIKSEKPEINMITADGTEIKLRDGAMRMLKAIATFNSEGLTRERAKTITGISSPTTFSTYKQELLRYGWIQENNGMMYITELGEKKAGEIEELPIDPDDLLKMWKNKFREGCSKMLEELYNGYPEWIDREDLKIKVGISSPTTFSTYKQELSRNDLIEIDGIKLRLNGQSFGRNGPN